MLLTCICLKYSWTSRSHHVERVWCFGGWVFKYLVPAVKCSKAWDCEFFSRYANIKGGCFLSLFGAFFKRTSVAWGWLIVCSYPVDPEECFEYDGSETSCILRRAWRILGTWCMVYSQFTACIGNRETLFWWIVTDLQPVRSKSKNLIFVWCVLFRQSFQEQFWLCLKQGDFL